MFCNGAGPPNVWQAPSVQGRLLTCSLRGVLDGAIYANERWLTAQQLCKSAFSAHACSQNSLRLPIKGESNHSANLC